LPKTIDLTDFSASSGKGLMSELCHVFELNGKNPAFAQQINSSNAKGFLWRSSLLSCM